ncbi:pyridine nucleotide-disulfide oxidoreductase-domain-containing protein [Bisporella sp. PMI_857]|nr:pyridine nucleotide-disulfide oxidoreductase-domain-containing protein [Bisporella sp. PMI_857]
MITRAGNYSHLLSGSTALSRVLRRNISTKELDAAKGGRERVVILGSGWAGFVLSRELDKKKFQPIIVSPRPYFVFTPLLASTAVGTLEFRNTVESVRARSSGVEFIQGWGDDVNFNEKKLKIEEASLEIPSTPSRGANVASIQGGEASSKEKGRLFDLKYDKLVVAVGCYSQTFGTPGVKENALFLKDVTDARKIRKRVLECFETAALPTTSDALKDQLLNFAIVGGGPTGVEYAAELHDLIHEDLRKVYPTLVPHVNITIYDVAQKILPMFDSKLAEYALKLFKRDGIKVKTQHNIESLQPGLPEKSREQGDGGVFTLKTKQEGDIGVGMVVWSTGLMMNPFIQRALDDVHKFPTASVSVSNLAKTPAADEKWAIKRFSNGGLLVDDHFRVKLIPRTSDATKIKDFDPPEATMQDVFAIGDVSVMEKNRLPATAQVANQEAKWLAKNLNAGFVEGKEGFNFKNLGVMTYLGNMKAIMQTGGHNEIKGQGYRRFAWLIWRGAYLTQTVSWRNKILIPIYWSINWVFGRDISRF